MVKRLSAEQKVPGSIPMLDKYSGLKDEEKRKNKSPPTKSSFSLASTLSAAYPIPHLQQRSAAIILGSLFCLQEIWPPSNQVSPKGSVSAYKPRRWKAQVLRIDPGMCVDSGKCLFECAFFRDFECETFGWLGWPSKTAVLSPVGDWEQCPQSKSMFLLSTTHGAPLSTLLALLRAPL